MSESRVCCVVRRDGEVLVEEVHDPDASERWFRPLGRSIDRDDSDKEDDGDVDGAEAEVAVRRAFEDVLGVELVYVSPVGTYDGVAVLEADIAEDWPYAESGFTVYDPESGETTRVCWLHVDDFRKYGETLRPDGLLSDLPESA